LGPDFGSDRTHRSQYDFIDGFTRNMRLAPPNAYITGPHLLRIPPPTNRLMWAHLF